MTTQSGSINPKTGGSFRVKDDTAWVKLGMPIECSGGIGEANEYSVPDCIAWLIEHSVRQAVAPGSDGKGYVTKEEQARLTHFKAQMAELDYKEKAGELVPAGVVEESWCEMVAAAKAKLLALPARIAPVAVVGGSVREVELKIRDEVYGALEELAQATTPD